MSNLIFVVYMKRPFCYLQQLLHFFWSSGRSGAVHKINTGFLQLLCINFIHLCWIQTQLITTHDRYKFFQCCLLHAVVHSYLLIAKMHSDNMSVFTLVLTVFPCQALTNLHTQKWWCGSDKSWIWYRRVVKCPLLPWVYLRISCFCFRAEVGLFTDDAS